MPPNVPPPTEMPVDASILRSPLGAVPSENHDAKGRFAPGNTAAAVAGEHMERFWNHVHATQGETVAAILADVGHSVADAPHALVMATRGLVQAVALRDSAFSRIVAEGGPQTQRGKARQALRVWESATDRALAHARVIGLVRVPKRMETLHDVALEITRGRER